MRKTFLAGVALIALVPAQALAQPTQNPDPNRNGGQDSPEAAGAPAAQGEQPASSAQPTGADDFSTISSDQATATPIDALEPENKPVAAAAPAPTGNPVLDRLNALEAKLSALEARNKQLEDEAEASRVRLESVEVRAAKGVQFGWAPTFGEPTGNFTFKVRGVLDLDYAGFNQRAGGYDFSNGTLIRRGRFGVDGTAFKNFGYRLEAEYVGNTVNLLDAYLSYTGVKNWVFTVGQQKAPFGLEANTSDNFNTFLERGMANVAFGGVGAERRVGITAAYVSNKLNAAIGLFGVGEAVGRNAVTPDEGYGVNARLTWDPILDVGRVVHVGVSGYRTTNFAGNTLTDVGDRPGTRVDGTRLVAVTIPGTRAAATGVQTGAKDATFYGAEAAVVYGPFSVQGEYGHLAVDRFETPLAATSSTLNFDGFYVFGSFFLTGESRPFKNGVVDRLKPIREFDPQKGNWGAFEVALRYDELDLSSAGLPSPGIPAATTVNRKGTTWTGALNWYLNGNVKILFNYIRFKGENSPALFPTPAGAAVNGPGTTAKGDIFATRLHLDF